MDKSKILKQALASLNRGKCDKTEELCQSVLAIDPHNLDALFFLGSAHLGRKRFDEAETLMRKVLSSHPSHIGALNNLGICLYEGRHDLMAGQELFSKVLALNPNNLHATTNLGNVYRDIGDLDKAEHYLKRAADLAPNDPVMVNNIGGMYDTRGNFNEAAKYYRRALQLAPGHPDIQRNLLNAEYSRQDKAATLRMIRSILSQERPDKELLSIFPIAKCWSLWDIEDKVRDDVIAMTLAGKADKQAFGMMNMYFLASPKVSHDTLFDMHRLTARLLESERIGAPFDHSRRLSQPREKLRIGYISGDFRHHAVNTFIRGLINHHDSDRFEVVCYSNVKAEDNITAQYRARADKFVSVVDLPLHELAKRIYQDQVDILVDLAGYTSHSKIAVMTYRPAPVQMIYLGYPYTTGMEAVDYIVCDPYLDGPGNATYFTEKSLQLPESFITFDSLHEQVIAPQPPHERNGYITFGSLNNIYKLNRDVIAVWSHVLKNVPDSRLIINHPQCDMPETHTSILEEFQRHGITPQRIDFVWHKHPGGSHLRFYNDIDIILDAFPLTGGTTTIDAVWMGVPVVTLVGDIYPERLSYSILSNVGLDLGDLIAFSREEYIAKAVDLANNPIRVSELHERIPEALKDSILCDPVRLTRHMEATLVRAWNTKFPQIPFSLAPADESVEYVGVTSDVEIATDGDLKNMHTYVLREQQGWFDSEYRFVLDWFQPGMNALDINASHGVYSLPLARKADNGYVAATTASQRDGRYLQRGLAHNGIGNLDIVVTGERRLRLDTEMQRRNWPALDFIRLNLQPFETNILGDGTRLFAEQDPLVMFNIKRGTDTVDTGLAAAFRQWGYSIYRFVPGLSQLVPWNSDEELDAFALNLFACKGTRAQALAMDERLVNTVEALDAFPCIQERDWINYLAKFAYSVPLLRNWETAMPQCVEWEVYWSALNLFARSQDATARPPQRLACLNTSLGILLMLTQASPTLPRLISLARVLAEAGKREKAAKLLQDIISLLESQGPVPFTEPFLAPSRLAEGKAPNDKFHQWLFACVLEQFERLRAFTSYFSGPEILPLLENISKSGFATEEMNRRVDLIKARQGV